MHFYFFKHGRTVMHHTKGSHQHHRDNHNELSSYHDSYHHHDGDASWFSWSTFDRWQGYNLRYESPHRDNGDHHHGAPAVENLPSAGLTAEIGGYAWASGNDTFAYGSISNTVEDKGGYTIAYGDATFAAYGHAGCHSTGHADAGTFLSVTGADLLIEFSKDKGNESGHNPWAKSETQYVAIDIHDWNSPNGPIVLDSHSPLSPDLVSDLRHLFSPHVAFSGNIADVIATAEALGANSFTSTLTEALTIENQFSLVAGTALVAVG
jgi:hypothetical protein